MELAGEICLEGKLVSGGMTFMRRNIFQEMLLLLDATAGAVPGRKGGLRNRMSSDLISRQAAIDILLEKLIQNGDMYLAADAPKWVESLQTAFDKEKAMKELRDAAVLKNEDGIWYVTLKDALDIVEKGGIE